MAITLNGTTGITTPGLIADSPTLTVDSANNRVGINTAAPANELEVWGTGTVALFSGSGGSGFIGIHDRDDGTLGFIGVDGGTLKFQTPGSSYSDKLVITSAGNVGIGTNNPTAKLDVNGVLKCGPGVAPFISAVFRDYNDGSAIYASVVQAGGGKFISGESYYFNSGFWRSDKTTSTAIGLDSGDIRFLTRSGLTANTDFNGPIERLRIKSNGIVQVGDAGLGSDNGDRRFEVIGSGSGQAGVLIANNAVSASGTCDIIFAPSNKITGAQIICKALEDFSTGANRTADLTFYTRKDGTLAEKMRILASGGITFNGDTAAANALDDYEEGTFTPGLGVSNGNITYSTQWGKYVKIGSVVYIWFRVIAINDANASLYFLTSLPYTVGGINGQYPGPCISSFYNLNIGSNATVLGGYWRHGETRFRFHSNGNNTSQLTPSTGTVQFEIRGEGFYPVS